MSNIDPCAPSKSMFLPSLPKALKGLEFYNDILCKDLYYLLTLPKHSHKLWVEHYISSAKFDYGS